MQEDHTVVTVVTHSPLQIRVPKPNDSDAEDEEVLKKGGDAMINYTLGALCCCIFTPCLIAFSALLS
jgi:hypothetical protein